MNIRKSHIAVALLSTTMLLLTACSSGDGSPPADESRELRVAIPGDASSLDPIRGSSGNDHVLLYPIYDTLVSYDSDLLAQPGLAESWELTTPTELKLNLREGVTFHDGTDFDAEAVKYNIERAKSDESNIQPDVSAVEEVRIEDEYSVSLILNRPDSALLMALADRAGMMVSPTAAEAANGDLSTAPVGAGGWSFAEWRHGESLRVTEFADYWDKESVRASAITMSVMPEPKTRVTSLRGGQQDIAIEIAPSDADSIKDASGVTLFQAPRLNSNMAYINTASQELGDPKVRKALSLAIDREAILKSGFFGLGTTAHSIMPDGYWAEAPASVKYDYDPVAAEALLAEAGASGMSFQMLIVADAQTTRIAEILKEQWAAVGVTVELLPRELVQLTQEYFVDKAYPAALTQWTGRPDPGTSYAQLFGADGFYNTSDIATPGLEEALAEQNSSIDNAERNPGLDRAAEAVFEDTSSLPLAFVDSLVGLSDDVEGFELSLLGKAKFIGVSLGSGQQ